MKDIVRKTAALILALAMIVTFTPIYGMGAIAYAEDEEVAAEQNTAGGEDLAAGEELSGDEAGEEDQVSPDEENPVVEEPVVEDEGDPEEVVVEETAGEEEPFIAKGIKKAPISIDKGDDDGGDGGDDPFADIVQADLERVDGDHDWFYDDGSATFRLTDPAALAVEGVERYEAFVSTGPSGGWEEIDASCYDYDDSTKTVVVDGTKLAAIPEYDDLWKITVQIKGLDENGELKMVASAIDVKFYSSYIRYDLPEDRALMPGWDTTINARCTGYVKNSQNPYGRYFDFNIVSIDVVEGKDLVDWWYSREGDDIWWDYNAGNEMGTVTLNITYEDIDGNEQTVERHLYLDGVAYDSNLWTDGNLYIGLPGSEIVLHADANHWYLAGDDRHQENTKEGLEFIWTLERGEDYAEIVPDESDPSRAVLRFKEVESGDYEDVGCRVKLSVVDLNSDDPEVERTSQTRWFDISEDYYMIYPFDLNQGLHVGQTLEDLQFELRHYRYGEDYWTENITAYKWNFDSDVFTIRARDEYGNNEEVEDNKWISDSDIFSITRKVNRGSGISLSVKFLDEEGEEREENRPFFFFDRYYNLWFEEDNIDVYSDAQEDPQFRVNTGDFGYGDEADELFTFSVEASKEGSGSWAEVIEPKSVTRDGDFLVITFDRSELDYNYKNYNIIVKAEANSGGMEPVERSAWIHTKQARYDIHMDEHMDMLPGWDRNFEDIEVWIENSEFPDGENFRFPIIDVEVVSGAENLEEMPTEENDWYFRTRDYGQVKFVLTYLDEHDDEQTFDVELNIGNDVYEVWQGREGPSDNGLPGTSIELRAGGVHKYVDENGEHRETQEGLDYDWRLADGEEFATLTVDENDHSHATLTFKELPEGEDWIDEEIRVEVGLMDQESDDPQEWRAMEDRNYWVRSEYDELWPTELGLLNLGQSTDDITFTVRHYFLSENGEAEYNEYSIDKMEWRFNQNDLSISFEEGEIYDGEEIEDDTFSFFRKKRWDTNADYTVWFRDENGGDCEMNGGFFFDPLSYDQWFDTHDAPVYDDWNWTINLQRQEELDYSSIETNIKAGRYEWHEEEGEDVWIAAPDDCWSLSEDGMSVTVYGDKMAENDIHEMWIYAEAMYNEEYVGESGECHVWLEESCASHGEEHLWLSAPPEYADCYSPGWQKQMCWNCGERRTIEVPARGHIATAVKAKAATASKEGNVAYWKCSFCGKCFSDKACTKEVTADSRIIPRGTTISKVAAASKGFTVTWKKPTGNYLKHTTGYEVQYALDSKFKKSPKTVAITKNGTVTKKVTKLKAKTKYFVRVRTYRTIDKKKVYGPWSKVKNITTK